MEKSLLFIVFNRIDTTKKVFDEIRKAKPPKLYLASDGPRDNKKGERDIVNEVRNHVLNHIDWECEVYTLFQENNLGCGLAVSKAITWFFSNEPEGIVLEDDCVPHPSFFQYCEELLDKYRDDKRIWHISGHNPLGQVDILDSYYFYCIMDCWGWAGWADRWLPNYEHDLKKFEKMDIDQISTKKSVQNYFSLILKKMRSKNPIDTWDYQWVFIINHNKGLCINPSKNLVSNIGYVGTRTFDASDTRLNRASYDIGRLNHPEQVSLNERIANQIFSDVYDIIEKKYTVYVFNIPVMVVKSLGRKIRFYLFGIIPIIKIRRK